MHVRQALHSHKITATLNKQLHWQKSEMQGQVLTWSEKNNIIKHTPS